jgi:predicted DNA-binding protein
MAKPIDRTDMATAARVSIPDKLYNRLRERADEEGRSLSSLLSFLIESKLREVEAMEKDTPLEKKALK